LVCELKKGFKLQVYKLLIISELDTTQRAPQKPIPHFDSFDRFPDFSRAWCMIYILLSAWASSLGKGYELCIWSKWFKLNSSWVVGWKGLKWEQWPWHQAFINAIQRRNSWGMPPPEMASVLAAIGA
jgi:hypothetical protein